MYFYTTISIIVTIFIKKKLFKEVIFCIKSTQLLTKEKKYCYMLFNKYLYISSRYPLHLNL